MPEGSFFINYTDGNGEQHTFKKFVASVGDATSFLAGDGTTIDCAGATPNGSSNNCGNFILAFLKAYEFIAPTGSVIRSVGGDFRVTGGPGVVDQSATFNVANFTPAGGDAGHGPYKTGFVASRSRAAASRRPAWLRIYTTAAVVYALPTIFDPDLIDPDFTAWLVDLTTPSGSITEYAVWTGYVTSAGSWESILPYSTTTLRIGAKNG